MPSNNKKLSLPILARARAKHPKLNSKVYLITIYIAIEGGIGISYPIPEIPGSIST